MANGRSLEKKRLPNLREPFATPSGETRLQFDRLAFDSNAAIDSLRPDRPFPDPLKTAKQLLMPLFVLAELQAGVARSNRQQENAAAVDALRKPMLAARSGQR